MTKDGKYGKLTIDVPQLVEKNKFLLKEAGVMLLDEKFDFGFIDLISKRYDTKKRYSNLSKVVFKTLTDLSGLENKENSKMKKQGVAILDELLKLGAISKDQHEKLYIGYLI